MADHECSLSTVNRIVGIVQDCSNSFVNTLKSLESCTKPTPDSPILDYTKATVGLYFFFIHNTIESLKHWRTEPHDEFMDQSIDFFGATKKSKFTVQDIYTEIAMTCLSVWDIDHQNNLHFT